MLIHKLPLGVLACAGTCLLSIAPLSAQEEAAAAPPPGLETEEQRVFNESHLFLAGEDPPPGLETEEQRVGYIIGTNIGQNMKDDQLDIDIESFVRGLTDALEDRELAMSEEQMMATMEAFQEKMMAAQQQEMAAAADKNATAGAEFLAENAKREGVTTTESGLQYEVIEAGEGAKPTAEDTVTVHYTGSLIDGTVFDSSVERGQPANFGVGQVIPGWTEALQLMPTGSKWRVFIPSALAYGDQGAGGGAIGPNETLIFEVELIEVN